MNPTTEHGYDPVALHDHSAAPTLPPDVTLDACRGARQALSAVEADLLQAVGQNATRREYRQALWLAIALLRDRLYDVGRAYDNLR